MTSSEVGSGSHQVGPSSGRQIHPVAADDGPLLKMEMHLGGVGDTRTSPDLTSDVDRGTELRMAFELRGLSGGSGRDDPVPTTTSLPALIALNERRGIPRHDDRSAPWSPSREPDQASRFAGLIGTVRVGVVPEQDAPLQLAQNAATARLGEREEPPPAPESPVSPDTVIPGPSPQRSGSRGTSPNPGGLPDDQLPDLGSVGYRLAPIRWGGTTGTTGVWSQANAGSQFLSTSQNLDLRAASYIYQPWFARVGGNFGVATTESKTSDAGSNGIGNNKVNSTSFNYGGDLSLFPVSRFPFQANFYQMSNVATAQDLASTSTSTRLSLRQNYRPPVGSDVYSANYDRSVLTTTSGESLVNSAGATYATVVDSHSINASLRYSSNSGDVGGQSLQLFGASASHSWRMDEDFSISSSANFSNSQTSIQTNALTGSTPAVNKSTLYQANTSIMWTPDPDMPLTVTGGGNVFHVQTDIGSDQNKQLTMNGQANANYRFSPNLGVSGGVSLGMSLNQDGRGASASSLNSSQNLGVSYSGDPMKIYDFSYGWSTGGSVSNSLSSASNGQSQSSQSLGGTASHTLSRVFTFEPVTMVNTYASQSVGLNTMTATAGTSGSSSMSLNHSAGAALQSSYSPTLTGSLSLSGSDSMSFGQNQSHFRSFSLAGSGQWQLSRRQSMNASANATWSQQVTSATTIPGTNLTTLNDNTSAQWSGGGSISYNHRNPFGVQNLQYGATYSFTTSQTNLRVAAGDPDALSWVISNTLLQRLDYVLGRVKFQVTASVAMIDRQTSTSVFFSMQRAFGDF